MDRDSKDIRRRLFTKGGTDRDNPQIAPAGKGQCKPLSLRSQGADNAWGGAGKDAGLV